jgi:hypothetical protein
MRMATVIAINSLKNGRWKIADKNRFATLPMRRIEIRKRFNADHLGSRPRYHRGVYTQPMTQINPDEFIIPVVWVWIQKRRGIAPAKPSLLRSLDEIRSPDGAAL